MDSLSRRSLLAALGAVPAAALIGCGRSSEAGTPSAPVSSKSGDQAVFPVTVKHKFGETTIEKKPTRVASVGYTDQDFILAFGYQPVLVRDWYGPDKVIMPWAKPYAGDLNIQGTNLGNQEISAEKVAASKPDLIIGVYSGMTQADYDKLSKIAPVIAQEADFIDYGEPWPNVTKQIGAALGQPAKAEKLVADLNQKFEAAKQANPQWSEQTLSVCTFGSNKLAAFSGTDTRSQFFEKLGFTIPEAVTKAAGDKFYSYIAMENAGIVDADVLIWDQLSYVEGGRATIEANKTLQGLKVMQAKHAVYLEPADTEQAFGWQTVLSLPYALEKVVPLVEKVSPKK